MAIFMSDALVISSASAEPTRTKSSNIRNAEQSCARVFPSRERESACVAHRFLPAKESLTLLLLDSPLVIPSQPLKRLLVARHLTVRCRWDENERARATELPVLA